MVRSLKFPPAGLIKQSAADDAIDAMFLQEREDLRHSPKRKRHQYVETTPKPKPPPRVRIQRPPPKPVVFGLFDMVDTSEAFHQRMKESCAKTSGREEGCGSGKRDEILC